jgi:hypothetical protein
MVQCYDGDDGLASPGSLVVVVLLLLSSCLKLKADEPQE